MTSLLDRETREKAVERRAVVSRSGERTPAELKASEELAQAFAKFDGSELAYVKYLTGFDDEALRRAGVI